jgi:hypothetical protein
LKDAWRRLGLSEKEGVGAGWVGVVDGEGARKQEQEWEGHGVQEWEGHGVQEWEGHGVLYSCWLCAGGG